MLTIENLREILEDKIMNYASDRDMPSFEEAGVDLALENYINKILEEPLKDRKRLEWLMSGGLYSLPSSNHGCGDEYELSRENIDRYMKLEQK